MKKSLSALCVLSLIVLEAGAACAAGSSPPRPPLQISENAVNAKCISLVDKGRGLDGKSAIENAYKNLNKFYPESQSPGFNSRVVMTHDNHSFTAKVISEYCQGGAK